MHRTYTICPQRGFSEEIAVDPKYNQCCSRKHHTTFQFRTIAPSRPDAQSLNVVRYSFHDKTFNLKAAVLVKDTNRLLKNWFDYY